MREDYTYVFHVLAPLYKQPHTPNPEDESTVTTTAKNDSEKPDTRAENARLIQTYREAGELLIDYSHELEETHVWSRLNDGETLDVEEDLGYIETATSHLYAIRDRREKIPPRHMMSFFATFGGATENEAGKLHFLHVREIEKISGKQSHNKLYGLVTDIPYIYEPEDGVLAYRDQFLGIQCRDPRMKGCDSWRVKVYYNKDLKREMYYCHRCKEWFNINKILLPGPEDKEKRSVQLNVVTLQAPALAVTSNW